MDEREQTDLSAGDLAAFAEAAAALGVPLRVEQVAAFARYRALLLTWNARINLTAITDPREVLTRHFLDSLTVALAVPQPMREKAVRLLDVGSGAGLPGLALAIAFPHWNVTALEATGKKVRFLEEVVSALPLANARALAGRAELIARIPAERAHYDIVTARALAALPTLLEYCQPFARVGGLTIAPKKGEVAAEVAAGARAATLLGGRMDEPMPVAASGLEGDRILIVVRQERLSPPLYPRPAGAARKYPLGR